MNMRNGLLHLTAAIIVSLLTFGVESVVTKAKGNAEVVGLLPRTMNSVDGLLWPCAPSLERSQAGLALTPGDHPAPDQRLLLGQSAAAHGDCAAALDLWQALIESGDAKSRLAHFESGRALYSLGNLPDAIEEFRLSNASRYIHDLAMSYRQSNRAGEALALFELAFAVQPTVRTADQLAQIYVEAKQNDRSTVIWQQLADSTSSDTVDHWLALAEAATLQLDWANAGAALEQALNVTDDPYQVYLRLGRVRMKQADWNGAIQAFAQAAELKPSSSSEPYTQAGQANANLGRYADAMTWFDLGSSRIAGDPWPMITSGEVANKFGMTEEAERRLRASVAAAPNHWGALFSLSAFLSHHDRAGEALPYLEQIAGSNNCAVLVMLDMAYTDTGETERAEAIRDRAAKACP